MPDFSTKVCLSRDTSVTGCVRQEYESVIMFAATFVIIIYRCAVLGSPARWAGWDCPGNAGYLPWCVLECVMPVDERQLVTYRTCPQCGFRLMRVERLHTRQGDETYASCPICGRQVRKNALHAEGAHLTGSERRQAWLVWLQNLGLTPETLDRIYHLALEDFFVEPDFSYRQDNAPIIR